MRLFISLTILLLCSSAVAAAQTSQAGLEPSPWQLRQAPGVELSALWPIYPGNFSQLRAYLPLGLEAGGLLVGGQARLPEFRGDEGDFNNIDAQVGWRQHLWSGLHIDGLLNAGLGRVRDSTIDGLDYNSFDIEVMALMGWRQQLGPAYLVFQPLGFAAVVYKSNPWPIRGQGRPTTEGPIYVGNILLGLTLD